MDMGKGMSVAMEPEMIQVYANAFFEDLVHLRDDTSKIMAEYMRNILIAKT